MNEMMNVHAAKTNFSKLLARVANGEEIVIAKDGTPVARLVPYSSGATARQLGAWAGKLWMSEDAIETPAWLLDAFEGVDAELPPPAAKRRKK
ncbi:MAG: type II toxin-antitoxin system prevent-host-death family antitoxin [bacterium]